mgnify:CR=1 FL=1
MKFLAYLVLLAAIAIAACGAYFSIVGLKLLFVGGGVSIIVMGAALEVGKLITATFLKQKWNDIGIMMKAYMMIATLFLMAITSVGIYGYLSAGYNATNVTVQGYEQQIQLNETKIKELEKEIVDLGKDPYNEADAVAINENRKKFIDQRLKLIDDRTKQIENIRKSIDATKDASSEILAAKQGLEISKSTLESDTSKELEQIKLYNARLEILDKEVQKWMEEGTGGLFKKNGLEQARLVKEGQSKERADIDDKIKSSQDRIDKLRKDYNEQVKAYNDRVATIENRQKAQRAELEASIKSIEQENAKTLDEIAAYNKESDKKIADLGTTKAEQVEKNKAKSQKNRDEIKAIHIQIDDYKEKIVHTDVGTFKFIAKSLNISLDSAVNWFIWSIMFVFDPLAVCLVLAFNVMISGRKEEKQKDPEKLVEPVATSTPTPTPTLIPTSTPTPTPIPTLTQPDTPTPTPTNTPTSTPTLVPTPVPSLKVTETPTVITQTIAEPILITEEPVAASYDESATVEVSQPPSPPPIPHNITSGKISPR